VVGALTPHDELRAVRAARPALTSAQTQAQARGTAAIIEAVTRIEGSRFASHRGRLHLPADQPPPRRTLCGLDLVGHTMTATAPEKLICRACLVQHATMHPSAL